MDRGVHPLLGILRGTETPQGASGTAKPRSLQVALFATHPILGQLLPAHESHRDKEVAHRDNGSQSDF